MSTRSETREPRQKIPVVTVVLAGATALSLTLAILIMMKPAAAAPIVNVEAAGTTNSSPSIGGQAKTLIDTAVVAPFAGLGVGAPANKGYSPGSTAIGGTGLGGTTIVTIDNTKKETAVPPVVVPEPLRVEPTPLKGITLRVGNQYAPRKVVAELDRKAITVVSEDVMFNFIPSLSGDGSFSIQSGEGLCLLYNSRLATCPSSVENTSSQWYLQPTTADYADLANKADVSSLYRIRSTVDNLCVSFDSLISSTGAVTKPCAKPELQTKIAQIDPASGEIVDPVADAKKAALALNILNIKNQKFVLHNLKYDSYLAEALTNLATQYAMKQVESKSPLMSASPLTLDYYGPVILGNATNVTLGAKSYSNENKTAAASYTTNWSHTNSSSVSQGTSWSITGSYSVTYSAEVSIFFATIKSQATYGIAAMYGGEESKTWTESETVGQSLVMPLNPGQTGWIMRANLVRVVGGHWDFTNDLGDMWTGRVEVAVDVPDSVGGGLASHVTLCFSDSDTKVCKDSNPLRS